MPVTREMRVVVGARGGEGLKLGDVVTIKGLTGCVSSYRELNTNMEIILSDGTANITRRVPLDSEINVLRTEPTDEERVMAELDKLRREADKRWERHNGLMYSRIGTINGRFHEGMDGRWQRPFDMDRAAELAQEQERYLLWNTVKVNAEHSQTLNGIGINEATARAVVALREQCVLSLTGHYSFRALSRSTSVIGNLMEDIQREARAEFIDEVKYLITPGIIELIGDES